MPAVGVEPLERRRRQRGASHDAFNITGGILCHYYTQLFSPEASIHPSMETREDYQGEQWVEILV
jgi:hypothetical protein